MAQPEAAGAGAAAHIAETARRRNDGGFFKIPVIGNKPAVPNWEVVAGDEVLAP